MRCDESRENLVAYLDGELAPAVRERLEAHLVGCEACRRERAALESTGDLLALLDDAGARRPDFACRVLDAVRGADPWCLHIRRELVAWLDGELGDVAERPVREHLEECAACSSEARALRDTGEALERWEVEPFSVDLAARLVPARPARGRLFRFAAVAAAAAVLLLAGLFAARPGRAPSPPPGVLSALEVLDPDTLDLLEDPELLELAGEAEWLDSMPGEALALLGGNGD